jgi:hypothetical protein
MTEKIIGYICLAIGIIVISIACYNGYQVFTGEIQPIQAYETGKTALGNSLPSVQTQGTEQSGVAAALMPMLQSTLNAAVDKSMEKPINLTVHILLLGFFASIGQKLALIGTTLVRPIVIQSNTDPDKKIVT